MYSCKRTITTIADVLESRQPDRNIYNELPSIQLLTIPYNIHETHAILPLSASPSPPESLDDKVPHLPALPPEITLKIISQLPLLPRVALALTCKRLAHILIRHHLLTAHATSRPSTIFSLRSYLPHSSHHPCAMQPQPEVRLFIPELSDHNPDWKMAYCDPYPDGPPVGNVVELRYLCDEDFRPVNPFIVRLVPQQPPVMFIRAQLRHPKTRQQDLLLWSSRLTHVRDGLRAYPEMTMYVTKGTGNEVCWEMLASALHEWDATGLLGSNEFGEFLEKWFEREKRRLVLWFGKKGKM